MILQSGNKLKENPENPRPCQQSNAMQWPLFTLRGLSLESKASLEIKQPKSWFALYPFMEHFYPEGSGLFQDGNAPVQRARGVTERFEYKTMCYGLPRHEILTQYEWF